MKNRAVLREVRDIRAENDGACAEHTHAYVQAGIDLLVFGHLAQRIGLGMQTSQRLLVVEDDVTVARALSRSLARRGYSVVIARSCAAARALSERFEFAILD